MAKSKFNKSQPSRLSYAESLTIIKNYFQEQHSIKDFCELNDLNYRSVLTALNPSKSDNTYSRTIQKILSVIFHTDVELAVEKVYILNMNKPTSPIAKKSPKVKIHESKQPTKTRGPG